MLQIQSILLPRDFSSASDQALRHAVQLARATGAALHVLYASVLHKGPFAATVDSSAETGEKIRAQLLEAPDGSKVTDITGEIQVETAVVRNIAAGPAILDYADDHDIDTIVMGTHGRRGVRRMLLGSVAEEVVRRAECPVLTVRGQEDQDFAGDLTLESILVPIDFSLHSRQALRHARELAANYNARLDLLHVIEEHLPPAYYVGGVGSIYDIVPDIEEQASQKMMSFYDETGGPLVEKITYHAEPGQPARHIASFAEENDSNLIVMSTHGLTGLEHFLMGSVAEKVVRRAKVPVFSVKAFGKSLLHPDPAPTATESS